QTLRYMQRQMAEETGNRCMEYGLYMTMWELWVAGRPDADLWAAQQLAELEKLETPALSAAAAQVFLNLRLSRYEEAQAVVESSDMINNVSTDMLLTFLNYIAGAKNWELLTNWLAKTAPAFYERRVQELATYIRLWNEAVPHVPGAERQMWSVLEQALPDSMWIIEDLLYEQHRWKLWLELQIQQEHGPLHHKVGVLQPIEKEAPELLLPYYHQAIHRCVSLKTRHDYKQAVKLLKRLEKVYKKMKVQGRWERFLIGFAERHSRLRALQEEMKKGKLLP
ncbi:MAG: hypothetical protein J7639_27540, partial [Paenibacillaceae bacterium]|nr:hypothetical protein [Paenibacillaceae bacterium]